MDCKCNPVGAQAPTVQASSTALRDKEAIRCHPFGWHLSLVAITRHPEEGHARGWGMLIVSMPRRGGLPLFIRRCRAVILRCEAQVGISKAAFAMVDRHRIAWNVVAYQ